MVALSGSWGQLAPSLVAMFHEANRIAPGRSTASDGSIGDQAHASRSSFHNPSRGWVDALDLTHDPGDGFDAHARARQVAARRDPRIDHVISNREIWSAARPYWRRYRGPNAHTQHAHFAVKRSTTGRASTAAWWSGSAPRPGPVPVPLPPPPARKVRDVLMARVIHTREVYFFEEGRYTHMKSRTDLERIAANAGLAKVEAEIGADTFALLAKDRKRYS